MNTHYSKVSEKPAMNFIKNT